MKRIIIVGLAILGMAACTQEDVDQAIEWSDAQIPVPDQEADIGTPEGPGVTESSVAVGLPPVPTTTTTISRRVSVPPASTAVVPIGTATVTATCQGINVVTTGWPDNEQFGIGVGAAMPWEFHGNFTFDFPRSPLDTGDMSWAVWSSDPSRLSIHDLVDCP